MASMNTSSPMHIKVLVVDDDWTSLSIVSSMLKKWSYEVVTVKSPVDAMATLRMQKNYFNLVVTDLHMPIMNGAELARQIKVEFKNIPVILMSADDKESVIVECLASGAVYYIIKPINPDDLKNVWQYAAAAARKRKSPVREEINVTLQDLEDIDLDGGPLTSSGEDDNNDDDVGFSFCAGESNKRNKASPRDDEDEGLTNSKAKKPKVIWTTVLHNLFLQAIRHIGLEKAVPKKILEFMRVPGLTRENVASHLQKYRLFLKRVAMRNLVSERALRSSFAVGHPSLMMARNAQLQQLYPNHIIGQQSLRLSTLGPPLFPGPRRHQRPSATHNFHYSFPNPPIPFRFNNNNNNNLSGRLINNFNMTSGSGAHSQGLAMNNIMQLSHHRNNGVGYGINGMGLHMMNANQHNVGTTNYNASNTCIAPMGHGAFGNLGQENHVSAGFGYPNQLINPNHDLGHLMINGSDTFSGNFGQLYPAVNANQFNPNPNPNPNNVVGPNQGGDEDDENAIGDHQVISNASVSINNNGGVEKSYSLDELLSSTLTTNSTNTIDLDAIFLDHINHPPPNPQHQDKGKEVMNCNGSANYNYNAPRLNEDLNFDELPDLFPIELENNASWEGQSLPIQNHNQADVEVVNSNFGTTTPYPPYQIADHNSFSQNASQDHLVGMRDNVYQPNHYDTSFLQNPNKQLQEGTGGSMDADLFAMIQNIGNTSNGSHHQYLNQQN